MKNIKIKDIYEESVLILQHLHEMNVQRYNAGKCEKVSESANEFKSIVDEAFSSDNYKGLKHLRKDLQQMMNALPKDSKLALKIKLEERSMKY